MPNPNRDDFRFDRSQLSSVELACDFVEKGPIAAAVQSAERFARFSDRFERVNLSKAESLNLLEALGDTIGPEIMANGSGTLIADVDSFFYLVKFGALIINGAYGAKLSVDDRKIGDEIAKVMEGFIDGARHVAQEYRKIGLSEHALKILDLLNCIIDGVEQTAEAARRVML